MFWVLLFIGFILIQIMFMNHGVNDSLEVQEIHGRWKESSAVVVDKMIERMNHLNPIKQKSQKYVLFIQTGNRKVVELPVSKHVFNRVEAGDHGIVRDIGEGEYDFEKVVE